jgi:hypothetical protein
MLGCHAPGVRYGSGELGTGSLAVRAPFNEVEPRLQYDDA